MSLGKEKLLHLFRFIWGCSHSFMLRTVYHMSHNKATVNLQRLYHFCNKCSLLELQGPCHEVCPPAPCVLLFGFPWNPQTSSGQGAQFEIVEMALTQRPVSVFAEKSPSKKTVTMTKMLQKSKQYLFYMSLIIKPVTVIKFHFAIGSDSEDDLFLCVYAGFM